jgi:hypothetical protein
LYTGRGQAAYSGGAFADVNLLQLEPLPFLADMELQTHRGKDVAGAAASGD